MVVGADGICSREMDGCWNFDVVCSIFCAELSADPAAKKRFCAHGCMGGVDHLVVPGSLLRRISDGLSVDCTVCDAFPFRRRSSIADERCVDGDPAFHIPPRGYSAGSVSMI